MHGPPASTRRCCWMPECGDTFSNSSLRCRHPQHVEKLLVRAHSGAHIHRMRKHLKGLLSDWVVSARILQWVSVYINISHSQWISKSSSNTLLGRSMVFVPDVTGVTPCKLPHNATRDVKTLYAPAVNVDIIPSIHFRLHIISLQGNWDIFSL